MKKPKPTAGKKADGGRDRGPVRVGDVDLETVRALAELAAEFDLAEVEVDGEGRIRVARRVAGGLVPAAAPPAHALPTGPASLALMPPAEPSAGAAEGLFIASPFVGTFYRAPSPEAVPFVEMGQSVRKGQVVCIVEAMKLMNEIESDYDGKVVDILVKNGEHVEYGQPLFRLDKS